MEINRPKLLSYRKNLLMSYWQSSFLC